MANVTRWGEYRFRRDVPDISGGVIEGRYLTMGHADGPRSGDIIYLAARSWELQTGWLVQGVHDDFPVDYSPTYEYEMTVVRVGADMVLYAPLADDRDGIGLRYDPSKPKGYVGRALVAGDDLPNITPPPGSVATYLYDYDSLSKTARVGDTALYNGVEWMYAAKTATLYTAWTGTANASTSTLSTVGFDGSTPHDFDTGEWVRTANLKPKPIMAVGDKWRVISSTILDFMDASGTVVYQLDSPDEPKYIGVNLGDQALYYDESNRPIVKWVWDGEKWNKQPLVQYLDQLAARNISADEAVVKMLSANIVSSDTFRTKSGRAGFNDDGFYAKDVVGNTTFEVDGETGDVSITGKVIRSKKTIDQWYGDTTIPGVPTGITASAALNMIFVDWDGTLSGGVPEDFGNIAVYVDGQLGGTMDESGSLTFGTYQTGSGHDVTARSFDKATPTPNQSALSAKVHVDVDGALSSSSTEWAQNSDPVNAPTSGWQQTPPTWVAGKYIWMRTTITMGDGAKSTTAPVVITGNPGSQGAQGNGITSKSIDYQVSDSGTSVPVGTWTATIPASSPGQYLWTMTTLTYGDGTTTRSYGVSRNGSNGATGADGAPGKNGVGISSTTISYAKSTSGTTAPTSGWQSTPPSSTPGQYLWTRTVWGYTDSTSETGYSVSMWGSTGAKGDTGNDGIAGKDGVGITSTTVTYQASSSGTTAPKGTWVSAPPSATAGQYVWTRTVWGYSDGTSETGYSVGKIGDTGAQGAKGATGADGRGVKSAIVSYQLSTSGTNVPTGSWSSSPLQQTASTPFLWSRTVFSYSDNTTSTTYSISKLGDTGAQGISVTSVTRFYQLSTSTPSQPTTANPDSPWSTNEPGYTPLWVKWTGTPNASTSQLFSSDQGPSSKPVTSSGNLYYVDRVLYSNGQFSYSPVQTSSSYALGAMGVDVSLTAVNTADSKVRIYAQGAEPTAPSRGFSTGDMWITTDSNGQTSKISVWNGSAWAKYILIASEVIVPSSIGNVLIADGAIDAPKVKVGSLTGDRMAAHAITADKADIASIASALVTSGQFKTTDGTVGFDSTNGFWVKDSNGNYLFRANKNGVTLNNVGLSAPTITGGGISGTTLTGNTIRTSTGSDRTEMNATGVTVYKGGKAYTHMGSDTTYGLSLWNPVSQSMNDASSMMFGTIYYQSETYLSTKIFTTERDAPWFFDDANTAISTPTGRIVVSFSFGNDSNKDNVWATFVKGQIFVTSSPHGKHSQDDWPIESHGLVAGSRDLQTGVGIFGLLPASRTEIISGLPKNTPLYPCLGIRGHGFGTSRTPWSISVRLRTIVAHPC